VKKQEIEHQHLISSHHKEMQALRDALSLSMEKFDSLFQKSEQELKDFKTYIVCSLGILKEKAMANESMIADQRRSIDDMNKEFDVFHQIYSRRTDQEKLRKDLEEKINQSTVSHLVSIQDLQRELKDLFIFLKEDFTKFKSDTEQKFCELIDQIETNFNVTKIDRQGVLKEIRIYEKNIFILEKKIENIYTLIKRINQRGETCPKQE
jgi:transposase-like protein